MSPVLYGIKNCDTMKKARSWLEERGLEYQFHDYKASGIDREKLLEWSRILGWKKLLNQSGTTFRKLPAADKEGVDEDKAISLMLAQPSMIRRPVLESGGIIIAGFKPEEYAAHFSCGN